jgi:hypothetical protein
LAFCGEGCRQARLEPNFSGPDPRTQRGIERDVGLLFRIVEIDLVAHRGNVETFARKIVLAVLERGRRGDIGGEPQEQRPGSPRTRRYCTATASSGARSSKSSSACSIAAWPPIIR